MQNIEYHYEKGASNFIQGAWDQEPDKVQWQDEETKLPCLIVRNPMGALCGYVGVSRASRFYGKNYDELDQLFDVHGGLTFSNKCQLGSENSAICHIVEDGEDDDIWWLGFDCAHAYDLVPALGVEMQRFSLVFSQAEYRNIEYVKGQCKSLAKQLNEFHRTQE